MTAPSDAALVRDIELAMAAGFNGARLHQKVFEERFLYHADRLGYLVWGEFADWGARGRGPRGHNQQPAASFVTQWLEALERDYYHPAIVGWCPLNETYQALHDRITVLDDVTRALFLATKLADPDPPGDRRLGLRAPGRRDRRLRRARLRAGPGGVRPAAWPGWPPGRRTSTCSTTGSRSPCRTPDSPTSSASSAASGGTRMPRPTAAGDDQRRLLGLRRPGARRGRSSSARFAGLAGVLLADPDMFGYCYTQLTDVFQEHNGIYRFDRTPKFDVRPSAGPSAVRRPSRATPDRTRWASGVVRITAS